MTPDELARKWDDRPVMSATSAKNFVGDCVQTIGGGFHPDSEIGDYVDGNNMPMFTESGAAWLDRRLDQAFEALGAADIDIYALTLDLLHKREGGPFTVLVHLNLTIDADSYAAAEESARHYCECHNIPVDDIALIEAQ